MDYIFFVWLAIALGLLWHGCRVPRSLSIHFSIIFFIMAIFAYWNLSIWIQISGGILIGFFLIVKDAIA